MGAILLTAKKSVARWPNTPNLYSDKQSLMCASLDSTSSYCRAIKVGKEIHDEAIHPR